MGRRRLSRILLDTHAWAWTLTADHRLSAPARASIEAADDVSISAISLYEIGQKVRLGKWPEMAPHLTELIEAVERQGGRLLPISPAASLMAATMDWAHRDPFDRIVAATALTEGLALISADGVFDEIASLQNWPGRVW